MSISYSYPEGRVKPASVFPVEDWQRVTRPPEKRPEGIFIHGIGAVSPAGWSVTALREALARGEPIPTNELAKPGLEKPFRVRQVPVPSPRPAFFAHPRLRRTSPISSYAVSVAVEALGNDAAQVAAGSLRLGVIYCVMTGCINYSRRFYDEVLRDPASASPLVFPETVFNAPASHLAAFLGTTARNYTLVGDPGTFLQGLALAADWLLDGTVDGCLVVGAEEMDWMTPDALQPFTRDIISSEGAGAVYLKAEGRRKNEELIVQLAAVTDSQMFSKNQTRAQAARRMRAELNGADKDGLLCDGLQKLSRVDAAEAGAWRDWHGARLSPKTILGEGSNAASAWQCVAAVDALRQNRYAAACVSVVGLNQQAIGAHFTKAN